MRSPRSSATTMRTRLPFGPTHAPTGSRPGSRLETAILLRRPGSRATLFAELDRPALGPLPAQRFELHHWTQARVNIDYHVEFDRHYYSVPYPLTGQLVEIRSTATTLEVFHRGERVASHVRSHQPYKATTISEHRPKSHQQHLAWPPSRLLAWAQSVGPSTAQLFNTILESKPHPEMGYRSCLGILRLGQRYSSERLEAAAERALVTGACSKPIFLSSPTEKTARSCRP